MGLEDRDWYRDAYREKERKYDGDFSLHGNYKKQFSTNETSFKKAPKNNALKPLTTIVISFYGSIAALILTSITRFAVISVICMFVYNIWMLINTFKSRPKTGIGTKILAVIFFCVSEALCGLIIYLTIIYPLI